MQGLPGYGFSYSGVLLIGILQGLCVWADDIVTLYQAPGSSLNLPVNYSGKLTLVIWKFNETTFAEYTPEGKYRLLETHFSGRVKAAENKTEVTVQDLQPTESGTFSITIDGQEKQPVIQKYEVYIQNPITDVQIEKNQTWTESTNSCVINLKCKALGSESLFYSWSGFKNESGAQLQFTLSPVEGAVMLNCTAANNVSNESASGIMTCNKPQTGGTLPLVWIAVVGGVALLVFVVIMAIVCRKCRKEPVADSEITVYADVNPGAISKKDGRSGSVTNGTSVYETVDDIRISADKTVYATVMPHKRTEFTATTPSPYEQAS